MLRLSAVSGSNRAAPSGLTANKVTGSSQAGKRPQEGVVAGTRTENKVAGVVESVKADYASVELRSRPVSFFCRARAFINAFPSCQRDRGQEGSSKYGLAETSKFRDQEKMALQAVWVAP